MAPGDYVIKVSGTDIAGNNISENEIITYDPAAGEKLTLTIDNLTDDNVINHDEIRNSLVISGNTNAEKGQKVTVTLRGFSFSATVGEDGKWSLHLLENQPIVFSDSDYHVTAQVNNSAGESVTTAHTFSIDITPPTLEIDAVTGDDFINADEHDKMYQITGYSDAIGQRLGLMINVTTSRGLIGKIYYVTVGDDGRWSVDVPAEIFSQLADGGATVTATVSDSAGNTTSAQRDIIIDTIAPTLRIEMIAGDNIIDSTEHEQPQWIGGTSDAVGQKITLTIGIHDYTINVGMDGKWSVEVPADVIRQLAEGDVIVRAVVNDSAGNVTFVEQKVTVILDDIHWHVTINPITGDNVINNDEMKQSILISGTAINAPANSFIIVKIDGLEIDTIKVDTNGIWRVSLPANYFDSADGMHTVMVEMYDVTGFSHASQEITVDTIAPTVTIDEPFGDGILNAAEASTNQTISGKSEPGSQVTVTLGSYSYPATVVNEQDNWIVTIPSVDLQSLTPIEQEITVTVTDKAGNTGTVGEVVLVDTIPPTVTVDEPFGDGMST